MALEPITRMEKILAGEKIDPVTRREYFVQEAIQNGGSETYETVAEIAVGEMEHMTGMSYATTEVPFPAISDTETYYLNDSENPNSGFVYDDGEVDGILWNCEIVDEQPAPIDSSKPYVFIGSNHGVIGIGSDEDLSNTTVHILKKASAPSGGSDRLVVTLKKVPYEKDGQTYYEWQGDKSYTEIKEALSAKKSVEVLLSWDFDGTLTDPAMIHLFPCLPLDVVGSILFSSPVMTLETRVFFEAKCAFDGEKTDSWDVVQQEVAQTKEFAFTVTPDGQGGYTATADSGSTYAAITAALAETPNVIAKVTVPNPTTGQTGETHKVLIDYDLNGGYLTCSTVVYSTGLSAPILIQLEISSSDVLTPRLITLAVQS